MRRLIFPLLLGIGGTAVLVALGLWQLDRLRWKEAEIARIEAQIGAPVEPLPATPDPEADRYRPVAIEGAYLEGEIAVLTSLKGVGPGYRVISPFATVEGRRVLVDRGFIGEGELGLPRPMGPAKLEGNLHWPEETDRFTPKPDLAKGIWFARDVPAMAEALGTEPVLVVLRATSQTDTPVMPLPVDTAGISNDHLEYAITWFALALAWLGMTAILIRRILRRQN